MKCDRCKTKITDSWNSKGVIVGVDNRVQLCPKCSKLIRAWLKGDGMILDETLMGDVKLACEMLLASSHTVQYAAGKGMYEDFLEKGICLKC